MMLQRDRARATIAGGAAHTADAARHAIIHVYDNDSGNSARIIRRAIAAHQWLIENAV